MSNFDRAVKALNDVDEAIDHLADNEAYVTALEAAGLLMPDVQVIRTPEELEALAREDAAVIVLAGEAGVARTARALYELRQLVYAWGLPAVVTASEAQVRADREAMEAIKWVTLCLTPENAAANTRSPKSNRSD